jgi:hypothetical protein
MALLLLVACGLMLRTFVNLRHVDPGFSGAAQLETMRIGIPDNQTYKGERVARIEEQMLHAIEAIPGVSKVGLIDSLPMDGGSNDPILVEDKPVQEGTIRPVRRFKYISPGYFSAVQSPIIAGRDLTWTEIYDRHPVALISENLARELWQTPSAALGKRIRTTLKDDWREIIGVVADLHDDGIHMKAPAIVYWPLLLRNFEANQDWVTRNVSFVIRTPAAGSLALRREIETAVDGVNASLPITDARTLGVHLPAFAGPDLVRAAVARNRGRHGASPRHRGCLRRHFLFGLSTLTRGRDTHRFRIAPPHCSRLVPA